MRSSSACFGGAFQQRHRAVDGIVPSHGDCDASSLCTRWGGGHSSEAKTKAFAAGILDTSLKTRPPDATHWSVRTLARHVGVSRTLVHGVWQRHEVQPRRVEKFKLSNDPQFEEKVRDVVGLYLNPPDRALVLCVDEKGQIQALTTIPPIRARSFSDGSSGKSGGASTFTSHPPVVPGSIRWNAFSHSSPTEKNAWMPANVEFNRSHPKEADIELTAFPYYDSFLGGGSCVGGGNCVAATNSLVSVCTLQQQGCICERPILS